MLKKDHREITLPDSKHRLKVRSLKSLDYTFVGALPDTFLDTFRKLSGKKDVSIKDIDGASAEFLIKCLGRGIVSENYPDNGGMSISSKHPQECSEKEYSFYDLSNADQAVLMEGIFSGGEGLPMPFPGGAGREKG